MYKFLPILLFAYGLLVSEDNIITKSKMGSYESLILQSELVIDVDDNYGLTLNIKFNPLEIKSVTPHPISNIEMFSKKISDSLISVFLFHSKAKRLPIFFKFNFTNIDGFYDTSNVEFFKIEIMDKDGNKSEYPNQYLKIDFSEINQINRNNNIYEYMNKKDIYNDSWAVIIGIDKYKFSDQLNYAVKDAEAVKDMLINKFDYPEENIRYLVNEEATLSEIKLNLGEVATSAGEDDRILVFYSGHGETLKGADGSEKGYIIPYEGRQDNPFGTGFAMDEILTTSQMSKSKHMLFLMDACYSGLMTEKSKGLSQPQEQGYLSKVANEKARQIITAGGRDEQVIERDEWQHSAFTKNLLAGLDDWDADIDNDGYVTADELGTYLRKSVTEDSDFQQTPQKGRFRNSGSGEFVFFSNHNAINQNVEDKSADAKLDYLISEMEELKSQKSSDDKVVEKAVNVNSSWFEKYGYEGRSIGFVALEDMYQIGIVEDLNEDWLFSIMYSHLGNKSIKNIITLHNSHSAKANALSVNLAYKYFLTERIVPFITGGAVYMMTSWEDTVQKTSGDKNVILFSGGSAVGVSLYQFEHPFPIFVGMQIGIMGAYLPMSYEFDEGIVTLDDWQIRFLPQFAFSIGIPK